MFPIDPQCFSWKNLSEEWRRTDVRGRTLRVLTLLVVLWLSLNPSLLPLAAYVDSVGIDVALALFEMQLVVGILLLMESSGRVCGVASGPHGVVAAPLWPACACSSSCTSKISEQSTLRSGRTGRATGRR